MSKVHMKQDNKLTNVQIKKFLIIQTKEMFDKCGKAFSNLWKHVRNCKGQNRVPLTTPVEPEQEQVPLAFNSGGERAHQEFEAWYDQQIGAPSTKAGYENEFKHISNLWESTIEGIILESYSISYFVIQASKPTQCSTL